MILPKEILKLSKPLICFLSLFLSGGVQAQIEYNWQNSKEGWVPGNDCNLTAQNESMAMRSFHLYPVMRSGTLNENLGIDASEYNLVTVTLKNPTKTNGNANARLFVYPPSSNDAMCYYNFLVDTSMSSFSTYTIALDSPPTSGIYEGTIARFGLRGPFGVNNGDTIYWKSMVVSNTNQTNDSVTVTFSVDMSQVTSSYTVPEINGDFNAWCGNCNPMTDSNSDAIFETQIRFKPGENIKYRFTADDYAIEENLNASESCTDGNENFTNRVFTIPQKDSILETVCWESCTNCSVGIVEVVSESKVYPNPSKDYISITSKSSIEEIVLRDITGRIIHQQYLNTGSTKINITTLEDNIYFLECLINNRWEKSKVVVAK